MLVTTADFGFILRQPLPAFVVLQAQFNAWTRVMKNILPVLIALIPFAAVVGACVTCP